MREIVGISDEFFNHLHTADIESFSNVIHYVANNLPYSFTQCQLLGILANVPEQTSDGLILGETPRHGKDIVLDKTDGRVCYLRREVPGLAFPETQILLALFKDHLYGPSHGINLVCLVKAKGGVCGDDPAPWCTLGIAYIEQSYGYPVNKGIHHDVGTPVETAGLDSPFPGRILGNQCLGGEFFATCLAFKGEAHGLLAHLYHPKIMASNPAGLHELEYILAREPAVCKQVIKPVASLYCTSDHVLEKLYLAFRIVRNALGSWCISTPFGFFISAGSLLFRQGEVVFPPCFSDHLMVYHHQAPAVTDGKHKGLEAQDHPVAGMAEYAAYLFSVATTFWEIGVVYNGADREARGILAVLDPVPELARDMVHYIAPVETVVIQEAVEDILACATYLSQSGFRIIIGIFNQQTRKNDEN